MVSEECIRALNEQIKLLEKWNATYGKEDIIVARQNALAICEIVKALGANTYESFSSGKDEIHS